MQTRKKRGREKKDTAGRHLTCMDQLLAQCIVAVACHFQCPRIYPPSTAFALDALALQWFSQIHFFSFCQHVASQRCAKPTTTLSALNFHCAHFYHHLLPKLRHIHSATPLTCTFPSPQCRKLHQCVGLGPLLSRDTCSLLGCYPELHFIVC